MPPAGPEPSADFPALTSLPVQVPPLCRGMALYPAAHARAGDVRTDLDLCLAERHRAARGGASADVDQPLPVVCTPRGRAPEDRLRRDRSLVSGGMPLEPLPAKPRDAQPVSRRRLLKAGLAAGATLAVWPSPRLAFTARARASSHEP
jgi:hypothetical protein